MFKITKHIKPTHQHLGDLINVIQLYDGPAGIFADRLCPCCGRSPEKTLKFLLTALDTELFYEESDSCANVSPSWELGTVSRTYKKAANLPEMGSHVACHFDAFSGRHYKELGDASVEEILGSINSDVINVGGRAMEGAENKHSASLEEKLHIVASAKLTIGIDDGIAHLAEVTNCRNLIIHSNKHVEVKRIYPSSAEVLEYGEVVRKILVDF